jgi:hypothetical protein
MVCPSFQKNPHTYEEIRIPLLSVTEGSYGDADYLIISRRRKSLSLSNMRDAYEVCNFGM